MTESVSPIFHNKVVAILGYSAKGRQKALALQRNGITVIVGLRNESDYWDQVKNDGFQVFTLYDAVMQADIIQVWDG